MSQAVSHANQSDDRIVHLFSNATAMKIGAAQLEQTYTGVLGHFEKRCSTTTCSATCIAHLFSSDILIIRYALLRSQSVSNLVCNRASHAFIAAGLRQHVAGLPRGCRALPPHGGVHSLFSSFTPFLCIVGLSCILAGLFILS